MNKYGSDPKVKKTLIRNYEQKTSSKVKEAAYETQATSSNVLHKKSPRKGRSSNNNNNVLSCPSLCSSEVLANYLSDVTKNFSPPPVDKDLDVDKALLNTKMTRMLNFHFNDRMYKNLVELNANGDRQKRIKDKRPNKFSIKKDLEPNIEDFINDEKDEDLIPTIPVPITKFKPVKKVENGKLHKLISSFEKL